MIYEPIAVAKMASFSQHVGQCVAYLLGDIIHSGTRGERKGEMIILVLECPLFRSSCLINLPFGPPSDIASRVPWPNFGPIWAKIEVAPPICNFEAYLYDPKN